MNKHELVSMIAEKEKLSQAHVEKVIDSMTDIIRHSVKIGHDVKLVGFGTFVKIKRKARNGRNPQTRQIIKIPATWAPKFKAGQLFKDTVK